MRIVSAFNILEFLCPSKRDMAYSLPQVCNDRRTLVFESNVISVLRTCFGEMGETKLSFLGAGTITYLTISSVFLDVSWE